MTSRENYTGLTDLAEVLSDKDEVATDIRTIFNAPNRSETISSSMAMVTAFCEHSLDNKRYWTLGQDDFVEMKLLLEFIILNFREVMQEIYYIEQAYEKLSGTENLFISVG